MFKYYFEQIQNVAIWPVISLAIFFGFFILLIWWLFKVDGGYIQKMKNLPLDKDQSPVKSKRIMMTLLIMLSPLLTQAQDTATSMDQETVLLWVMIMVFILSLLVLMVAIYTLRVLQIATQKQSTAAPVERASWWEQFWDRLNKSVPQEREADVLLDHNYDGIRELDNHLPPWWTALFYISIVGGIVYMFVYHVFETAPLPDELYRKEVAAAEALRQQRLALEQEATGVIDESTVVFDSTASALENGAKVYLSNCASCHREDGGGNIGPNLTDNAWIHGGSMQEIFATIKNGVPAKGMISWEPLLSPLQMKDVSSYIISIGGTDPPAAKAPEGTEETE